MPTMNAPQDGVGRAIKVLRTERGLERRELAEQSGISYPYLSEIENGRKQASTNALRAIAGALDMRPHDILAKAESIPAHPAPSAAPAPHRWVGPAAATTTATSDAGATMEPLPAPQDPADELVALVSQMTPEDAQRVLDLARRLAR